MSERKNLEHLFQEKLERFEVAPPEELWSNIEAELKKEKKKRRIIPLWWKLSGVAALFVVGFGILSIVTDNSNSKKTIKNTDTVVTTENTSQRSDSELSSSEKTNKTTDSKKDSSNSTQISTSDSKIAVTNASEQKANLTSKTVSKTKISTSFNSQKGKNAIATHSNKSIKRDTKNQIRANSVNNPDALAQTDQKKSNDYQNTKNTVNNLTEKITSGETNNQVTLNNPNNIEDDKIVMKNQNDIAKTKDDVIKKQDSIAIAAVEPNAMEELLNEKEKESTQKQKINRWQVTPNLAPVYFGSFANGSPLDEMLDSNTKSYTTHLSYGIGVNYAVSKKVKIRTGINVLNVDYDTQEIVFYQDVNAKTMKNIDPTAQGSLIQIKPLAYVDTQLDRIISERFDGVLNQKMGYIEMPLEMSYKVLDKKFGVELIGGFSTLYLNNNEVFLRTDGLNMKIGEANNLNTFHFSSNFGVGLNYKLFKNFDARIEPSFKYQINTFSTSTEFKPYIFGVYSGVSYRF